MIIPQIGRFFNSYFYIFIQILYLSHFLSKGCDCLASIFVRTIVIYLILLFIMRLSGKRQIGELQISELITTFLLSELASVPLVDPATPLAHAIIPIFTIISLEIIFSFLTTKGALAKRILDDKPSIIIRKGMICKTEMERVRLSMDDLLCEMRLKDIASVEEVDYAILEPNGKISVFPKNETHLAHALIIDGVIQKDTLSQIKKTEAWVRALLEEQNETSLHNVFLLCATDNGCVTLIRKEDCQ